MFTLKTMLVKYKYGYTYYKTVLKGVFKNNAC